MLLKLKIKHMSFIQVLSFFHILGASLWLGSSMLLGVLGLKIAETKEHNKIINLVKYINPLSKLIFKPATFITLLAGVWIVYISSWVSFGDTWIVFALIGIAITFFLGGILIPKLSKKILKNESSTALVLKTYKKLNFIIDLDSILLIIIFFDMVYKPKLNETEFWLISIVFLLISVTLAYRRMKSNK